MEGDFYEEVICWFYVCMCNDAGYAGSWLWQ